MHPAAGAARDGAEPINHTDFSTVLMLPADKFLSAFSAASLNGFQSETTTVRFSKAAFLPKML
jgi:hypothetical protein